MRYHTRDGRFRHNLKLNGQLADVEIGCYLIGLLNYRARPRSVIEIPPSRRIDVWSLLGLYHSTSKAKNRVLKVAIAMLSF